METINESKATEIITTAIFGAILVTTITTGLNKLVGSNAEYDKNIAAQNSQPYDNTVNLDDTIIKEPTGRQPTDTQVAQSNGNTGRAPRNMQSQSEPTSSIEEIARLVSKDKYVASKFRKIDWCRMIAAIEFKESRGKSDAVGDDGSAVGAYQIWPIMVKQLNIICKRHKLDYQFDNNDRLDKNKSRMMCVIYLSDACDQYYRKYNKFPSEGRLAEMWNKGQIFERNDNSKRYGKDIQKILPTVKSFT